MSVVDYNLIISDLFEGPLCSEIAKWIESSLGKNGPDGQQLDRIYSTCFNYYCVQQKRPLKDALACVEKLLLTAALVKFNGNRSRVAKYLGIERNTLYTKLKKHALDQYV